MTRPAYPRLPDDSPDYPGITHRTKMLRGEFPHLSPAQAYVMAAVEIRPDRNGGAEWIGWDSKRRPLFRRPERHAGDRRYTAQTKSGDPTEPAAPFDLLPHVRREGAMV